VAATNCDLDAMAGIGKFRKDLLYRLDVVRVEVPPLRRRREDVTLLVEHVLAKLQSRMIATTARSIAATAATALVAYDWPGNVRELENVVERALALSRTAEVRLEDLPPKIRDFVPKPTIEPPEATLQMLTLAEYGRRHILAAIELAAGNRSHAARLLGVDRRVLHRRLQRNEPTVIGGTRARVRPHFPTPAVPRASPTPAKIAGRPGSHRTGA
jgi:DNA-binding NtrC family response regulator